MNLMYQAPRQKAAFAITVLSCCCATPMLHPGPPFRFAKSTDLSSLESALASKVERMQDTLEDLKYSVDNSELGAFKQSIC